MTEKIIEKIENMFFCIIYTEKNDFICKNKMKILYSGKIWLEIGYG